VTRYRLSDPAKADIASVLRTSEAMHGAEARIRYRALLTAALRRIAADPQGRSTVDRSELFAGLRSLHIRHSRAEPRGDGGRSGACDLLPRRRTRPRGDRPRAA
jgi:toxin ParE1/3/4